MPTEFRLGRQVVSWGESTFIQGGLNTINHFDVSALRVPGSELKEAFLPQEMAVFNLQFSERLSGQFLYILDWNDTEPEPAGSYFSTNDFATPGGQKRGARLRRLLRPGRGLQRRSADRSSRTSRTCAASKTRDPDNNGQFGVNFKMYLPDFNNGTEFGLYFLNYHSRLPVISGQTGTQAGLGNAFGALNAAGATAQALGAGVPLPRRSDGRGAGRCRAAQAGGNLSRRRR